MNTLGVMHKMHKNELNDLVYSLKKLEAQKNSAQDLISQILAQTKLETDKYQGGQYSSILASYLKQQDDDIEMHKSKIQELEVLIQNLQEEIGEKFAEIKKLELLIKNKDLKAKQELDKLESDAQDEMSSQAMFRSAQN